MINELIINGFDAFRRWGVRMGDEFLDVSLSPRPMKPYIENKSRLEHGKRVIIVDPKLDEREITLTFTIEGESEADYMTKYRDFRAELEKGNIEIKVPELGPEVYKLNYLKSASFAMSIDRTFSKMSVKFCEPNPSEEGRRQP